MQPQSGGGSGLTHRMSAPCTGPSSNSPEWTVGAGPGDASAATMAVASSNAPRPVVCKNRPTVLPPSLRNKTRDMRLLRNPTKTHREGRSPGCPGNRDGYFGLLEQVLRLGADGLCVFSRSTRNIQCRAPVPDRGGGDPREHEGPAEDEEGSEGLPEK